MQQTFACKLTSFHFLHTNTENLFLLNWCSGEYLISRTLFVWLRVERDRGQHANEDRLQVTVGGLNLQATEKNPQHLRFTR